MKTSIKILFVAIALVMLSCDNDIELPSTPENQYLFSCATEYDTNTVVNYGFQVVLGDTLDCQSDFVLDYDLVLSVREFGELPSGLRVNSDTMISFSGKYCQMFAYYTDSAAGSAVHFVPVSFYCTKGGELLFSECSYSGRSMPFLLN